MASESPIVNLARWRMLKARKMLQDSTLPICAISEKRGYRSGFSFAGAFNKLTGLTAGEVRKAGHAWQGNINSRDA